MQPQETSDNPARSDPHDRQAGILADIYCPKCSYNLRGAVGDQCSECGHSLANIRSRLCQIPWVRRRELGRFYGFWQTVWMVTFRNQRFCEEYARPVGYADARTFQWVTIIHVYLPALVAVLLVYLTTPAKPEVANPLQQMMMSGMIQPGLTLWDRAYAEMWPVAILLICFLLFLAAATGVPSYFLHPRTVSVQQQNTAIAMSYYTCGPLALTPVILIVCIVATELFSVAEWGGYATMLGVIKSTGVLLLMWWLNLVRTTRRMMPQVKGRRVLVAVGTPLLWLILAGLTLVVLPLAVLSVLVVLTSLA
ncbi:MAG: hypothetical protein KAV00_01100 [Phycisphaerae bacterium]|nr:hypothetical protein [Phycisphaerae bacterium]